MTFDSLKRPAVHYGLLLAIALSGLALRFWQLGAKPLWLDEVIAALFTMGRSQADVPQNVVFPLSDLTDLFTVQSGVSCAQIAQTVATQSVHPPLFFCLLYQWMVWLQPDADHWVWALRSLPAFVGVGGIVAIYILNRLAFSAPAGLAGAALMAVSPFAVYLSQEARHYTLPMLLVTIALMGLVCIQRGMERKTSIHPGIWIGWMLVNILGLYVHYFFILVIAAQILALLGWMVAHWCSGFSIAKQQLGLVALSLGGVALSYLPWLPTMISHLNRPETDWLTPYKPDWSDRIAPIYQTLVGWVLMVVALPVENQSLGVIIPCALVMLAIAAWVGWSVVRGLQRLWRSPQRSSVILLGGFVGSVVLEFFAITYILDKDITSVPRYNFVYYPGMVALIAAGLAAHPVSSQKRLPGTPASLYRSGMAIALGAGLVSSVLVVHGWVFQKGYYPQKVAQDMVFEPSKPVLLAVSYQSLQEIALGLSFALEIQHQQSSRGNLPVNVAFVQNENGYPQAWRRLARLRPDLPLPLNLWAVASPGMKTEDYPEILRIRNPEQGGKLSCPIDPDHFNRIGFPYQLFRCDD